MVGWSWLVAPFVPLYTNATKWMYLKLFERIAASWNEFLNANESIWTHMKPNERISFKNHVNEASKLNLNRKMEVVEDIFRIAG